MKVVILFGGKSAEHEVSIMSARNVFNAIDPLKHDVIPIGIDKEGLWHLTDETLQFGEGRPFLDAVGILRNVDVVFPVLHGPFGEDGSMQGMLEIAGIPYVGPSVLGSAIGLDKDVTKRLLRDAGINVAKFLVFEKRPDFEKVRQQLGIPMFIKPATMGSSIGLTKVYTSEEFDQGLDLAFSYDSKIIIEQAIVGREIECSVLEDEELMVSLPGEIITKSGSQTYEDKYFTSAGAQFILPVPLPQQKVKEIQEMAIRTFKVLCCDSMARVDFFMEPSGRLYLNEINTIPGFTSLSVYPRLWEASGMSQRELVERLLQIALRKAEKKAILAL